ncbi:hypothetical protein H7849_12540 [Alloacidobacterium dinghuense]|uniref:Uncharacterized protein n=1 Tax=Alloacidobacterium dinghuense TaxID=2763107 RepID=A0A7G8BQ25_9BACT|nr:hypothetical protein [Alloacidobacterium dinghuense]QNI34645.1 hypothetical protein H7849_12540 [Alloacidobacterium dinghuense]
MSGTVTAINPAAKTIVVNTNDGSFGLFNEQTKSDVALLFENDIRSRTMPADTFKDKGAQVIVYYFGGGFGQSSDRTVVALQNLGAGPIEKDTGTVVKFNKHALTIKTDSGSEETFQIGDTAVAETATGAARAERFDPGKGEQVRVIAALDNGQKTLLFVREM